MDIKTLLEFDDLLPFWQARLLAGPAGIGKSSAVKMIAMRRGYNFIDLRLSELEPADLVGLPFLQDDPDTGDKVTHYARPFWWPKDGKTILFLDEVDRCREDMQPLAMQLTLDRRAGGRNLPDGVIVFAACNGEKYMTSAIDQALVNRFAYIDFTPTAAEWLDWATKADVNPAVVGFIRSNQSMLDTPEKDIGQPNVPVPTRRSWANLGLALNNLKGDLTAHEYLHLLASPFIGLEAAMSFATWVKEKYQVLSPKEVFSGKVKAQNVNIVQISQIIDEVVTIFMDDKRDTKAKIEKERLNCLRFFMEAGHEAFGALFSALPRDAAFILESYPEVDKYIKDSIQVLKNYVKESSAQA